VTARSSRNHRARGLSGVRLRRAAAAAAVLSVASYAGESAAQEAVALDGNMVFAKSNGEFGIGVDARAGYRTGLPRFLIVHSIILQPEAIAGYERSTDSEKDNGVGRLGGGLRLGILFGWLNPFAFAHVCAADAAGAWGHLEDLGGALDWRFPTHSFGVQYAHQWVHLSYGTPEYQVIGLHAEFRGFWF
jgi:hypothetical protein